MSYSLYSAFSITIIHIFRNSEIIGGPAHEVFRGKNLFLQKIESSDRFIGFNEYARFECLSDFLNGKENLCFKLKDLLYMLILQCAVNGMVNSLYQDLN